MSELKSVLSSLGIIDVEENAASMLKLMDIDGQFGFVILVFV